jgi:hypothetical protein
VAEIKALLKACDGSDFAERRDKALILTYLDMGARLSEIVNVRLPGTARWGATSIWTARCFVCSARTAGRVWRRSGQRRSRPSIATSG